MNKPIGLRLSLKAPAVIVKKEKWYVSSSPVLDVCSQGATEEEAKQNLSEALSVFFYSCLERGTLYAVLKDCGFTPGTAPTEPIDDSGYIDVPLPMMVDAEKSRQCHA